MIQGSYLSQVRRLKVLAIEVVKQYPIKVRKIEFIQYGANAIFKVTDSRQKKYLLRINPTAHHTKKAILEEFKWLNVILKTTALAVPKPIFSNEGQYLVEHTHSDISTMRYCSMFEWLEGRFLWNGINNKYAYHVGSLTAQLEAVGTKVKTSHRQYWDTEGLVGIKKPRLCNVEKLTGISRKHQEIITDARRCAYKKIKIYENKYPHKLGLIHEDLNPNNIIVQNGNYGAIDFDDCGVGIYGYDLMAPLFAFEYLTEGDKKKEYNVLKDALFQGYADNTLLSQEDLDIFPYFMLAKKLCSITAMEIRKDNPKLKPWFQIAIDRTIAFYKLNKF